MDLSVLREQRNKVETLRERISCVQSALLSATRAPGKSGGSGCAPDRLCGDVVRLMDIKRRLVEEVLMLEDFISAAEQAICTLPIQEREIMRLRYIGGLNWDQVARRSHYSERHCRRIHEKAFKRMLYADPSNAPDIQASAHTKSG